MQLLVLCVAGLIVLVDQIIKIVVTLNLSGVQTIPVIENIFHFTYVENRGAAFGLFAGNGVIISLITSIILVVILYIIMSKRVKATFLLWCGALIMGGGFSNLIDRLIRGFVVDYIDVRIINFAIFNFADCCVVIGSILIIVYILFFSEDPIIKIKDKNKAEVQHGK